MSNVGKHHFHLKEYLRKLSQFSLCTSTQTHQFLHQRATERYTNCCDEGLLATGGYGWSGQKFYFRSINVVFCRFFSRSGSIKRVLAQLTLPQRGCVSQPAGPEVAPPSVFNGRNCISLPCWKRNFFCGDPLLL